MRIICLQDGRPTARDPADRAAPAGGGPRAEVRSLDPAEVLAGFAAAVAGGRNLVLADPPGGPSAPPSGDPAAAAGGGDFRDGFARARQALREGTASGSLTLYTSGTTGKPAAVVHGIEGLLRGIRIGGRHEGKTWGLAYNPTHIAGLQVLLQALANDCDLVDLFGAGPGERFDLLRATGVTHLSATPTFYRLLLAEGEGKAPVESVERVTFGGERLAPGLAEAVRKRFPNAAIRNIYASTEAGTLLVSDSDVFEVPPARAESFRVADGRLWLAPSLLGRFDGSADWFDTGDRLEVLSEAPLRFRFAGREADDINVGGYNVNPAPVEDHLRAHPGVREARVSARPNPVLGRILVGEVVRADDGLSERALRVYLEKRFPPHEVPRKFDFVDGIGMSRTGKLAR